jgi:imidazolonepropionase-like amidohydrolase
MTNVSTAWEHRNTEVTAIVGGTVIDGNGGAPIKDGVIVMEGKRISAVGDRATPVPAHAKTIFADGKFVIPGFIGETILIREYYATTFVRYEGRYDELVVEASQLALKGGLTTVIDLFGPRDDLLNARTAINEGKTIGPRIRLCGGWVGTGGYFNPDNVDEGFKSVGKVLGPPMLERINSRWKCNVGEELTRMSPVEVREEIRKYAETGIDFLFVATTCGYGAETAFRFSPRVLQAIIEEAHRAGLVVDSHCMYSEEAAWTALDAGADLVYIAPTFPMPLSADLIDLLAKRQIPLGIAPFTHAEMERLRKRVMNSDDNDHFARTNRTVAEHKVTNEQALLRAGVQVTFKLGGALQSADTLNHHPSVKGLPAESGALGKAHFNVLLGAQNIGMKPMEILTAATRNVARAYKVDKDLGTLEKGKFADLLILDRNPLEDAKNYCSISVVIKDGRVIDRDALPTQKLLSAESSGYYL